MEEEIIGNRWKELDYDGYYLVSPPYAHLRPFSFPSAPERREKESGDERKEM